MLVACGSGRGRPTQDQAGFDSSLGSSNETLTLDEGDISQVDQESAAPTGDDEEYVQQDITPPSDRDIAALERLNPPTNVAASDNTYNDKVRISWNHPTGGPATPTVYYIYRSITANNPTPTYIGGRLYPSTYYYDTTATPGTTYYYKLRSSRSGYSNSYYSNEDSGKRSNRMNPPVNVQASDGTYTDKVLITWNPPSGMPPTGYYIYRSATPSNPNPTYIGGRPGSGTYYSDTTATPGTTYYYKVKSCRDGYSNSYFSNENSGWRAQLVLNPPTGLAASDGTYTDKVRVTWSHPGSGATPDGYKIYRDGQLIDTIGYLVQYDDPSANPGTTYNYKARSYKSGYSDSGFSNEDSGWRNYSLGEPNNGLNSAYNLPSTGTYSTTIGGSDTWDCFKFTATSAGAMKVTFANPITNPMVNMYLAPADNGALLSAAENYEVKACCRSGDTFYIGINGSTLDQNTPYSFTLSIVSPSWSDYGEPNNDFDTAYGPNYLSDTGFATAHNTSDPYDYYAFGSGQWQVGTTYDAVMTYDQTTRIDYFAFKVDRTQIWGSSTTLNPKYVTWTWTSDMGNGMYFAVWVLQAITHHYTFTISPSSKRAPL